ncbi:hypothetical protein HBN50_14090 [Halobacteriovorax sp. GB3]|uniref:hypothetical protein n=1 Tax=Halobacteriovorax sp. GB3 TaxID=2719615 RepID=UPI002361AC57|nr:hypothetical protein [Halobacteriovorax sp. GB3]MDD0854239.1 hypothetical protein [Halobacteriovorax sp. GB3]
MKKLLAHIMILTLVLGDMVSFAKIANLPSLEWQRQELEQNIHSKVTNILDSIVTKTQYNVDVEVITGTPEEPDFNKSEGSTGPTGGTLKIEDQEVEKTEEEKAEEARLAEAKKSKALVKFTDVEPAENTGDYIVFSKFGMEAPLVDDFNDFQPEGKIVLTMENDEDKKKIEALKEKYNNKEEQYVEQIKKLQKQSQNKISAVEQMWKYNNSVDVFKNLKSVNVTVRLSESLDDEVKQKIEKYVRDIKFNLGKTKPQIKFEYGVLGSDLNEVTFMDKVKEVLDFISKFATLMGIVLGVILFGFVGNKLINRYFELNSGTQNSGNFKMEGADAEDEDDSSDDAGMPTLPGFGGADGGVIGLNGVERFKYFIKNTPNDAIMLVKRWISAGDKQSNSALRALVQQMDNDELKTLFQSLSEAQRNDWRALLDKPLTAAELTSANDFISNQIVQSVIVPSEIDDPETYDLILKLKPENVARLVEEEPAQGALLMNALSLNFVNQVLNHCEDGVRDSIINKSVEVTQKDVLDNQEKLKQTLQKYVEVVDKKPFVDKVAKLIPMSKPELENSLFKVLAKKTEPLVLKTIAFDNFPAELIQELPEQFLKNTLTDYPLHQKVRMLLSVDEGLRSIFLDIFAPEGTKANDLITIEFDSIERDEGEYQKVLDEASDHWFSFVKFVRKEIKRDKQFTREISDLLENWSDNIQSDNETQSHLRAVA